MQVKPPVYHDLWQFATLRLIKSPNLTDKQDWSEIAWQTPPDALYWVHLEGRETTPPPTSQTPLKSPPMRKIESLMNQGYHCQERLETR